MKLMYMGTAAAEGIPALFCQCEICSYAQKTGGRNQRLRSCVLLNHNVMLDFTPDMLANKMRFDLDLAQVEHIFFTHSHIDHLAAKELCYCHKMYAHNQRKTLHLYGNQKVLEVITQAFVFDMGGVPGCVTLHPLAAFATAEAGGLHITPLPAKHDKREDCFFFLVEQGDARLLYANDTTMPPAPALEFLRGKHLDVVSMDCTMGKFACITTHMGFPDNVRLAKKLRALGCIGADTRLLSHHFSHNGKINYDDFEALAQGTGFASTYDGLTLDVGEHTP